MSALAWRFLRPRTAGWALLAAAVVLAPTAAGNRSDELRSRDSALAAKSRAAVLSLYAIESKLTRARGRLTAIEEQAQALRREREAVDLRLEIARRGVRVSQNRLAGRLRALYEHGELDPIAIVLGADSLDTALTGLDNIGQMARGDRVVAEQVRGARHSLAGLRRRLADRQARLDRLVAAAAETERSLTGTVAVRRAYVGRLATERRLNASAIASLEAQARAAQEKAQTLEVAAAPPTATAASLPETAAADTSRTESAAGERTITVSATGYALPGSTATGIPVGWGVAAVDPSVIPLGSHFTVPGYGEAVAADVGGSVRGATIDLWFPTPAQAHAWGRRTVTIVLH
jgi:3D (Asp-Asp-Asp) domain-containing protein